MNHEIDQAPEQRRFEQWLDFIDGENHRAVERFLSDGDHRSRIETAPGSRSAHHAWRGGYREHVRQTMLIAEHQFRFLIDVGRMHELPEHEQFTLSDALTVLFLHDIEKPFVYSIDDTGDVIIENPMDKGQRRRFRADIIDRYGFTLTTTMANALQFVEGERDVDYVPGGRAEQPLASLCQVADNFSARALYDHGRPDVRTSTSTE